MTVYVSGPFNNLRHLVGQVEVEIKKRHGGNFAAIPDRERLLLLAVLRYLGDRDPEGAEAK